MSDIPVSSNSSQIIAANDKIFIAGRGDNIIVLESNPTAVHNPENDPLSFSVYPNPAHDQFNMMLNLDVSSHLFIELFTRAGFLVDSRDLGIHSGGQHRLSLPFGEIIPGLYYLRLKTGRGDVIRKVIIMK